MSIPTMGRIIPPPLPNKNKLWNRYASGEKLNPTFNHISTKVVPPSLPDYKKKVDAEDIYNLILAIVFTAILLTVIAGLKLLNIQK